MIYVYIGKITHQWIFDCLHVLFCSIFLLAMFLDQ
uniref:Uncharacterized protein n=1 Tax=Anguilla anguilla TaxID=7936 RepID=A0A0E9QZC4_ANGAN